MRKTYCFNQSRVLFIIIAICSISQISSAQYIVNDGGYINVVSGTTMNIEGDVRNESTGSITNQGEISISGDMINNGSSTMQTGSGIIELNGAATQSIEGTNTINFYNLSINNTSTGITLSTNTEVTNTLNMADGDVNLNGQTIELGTTGTLTGETNNNRIYGTSGTIQATRDLNAPSAENVAGLGLEITSAANMGTTIVSRGHATQSGPEGNLSIERYYDVTPSTNTGLNATITFNYLDNELGSHTETNLVAWKSTDGGSTWSNEGGTINTTSNNLSHSAIDGFSRWTLSDQVNNPLPIELLSFTASVTPRLEVQLDWITASEINSSHFEVQRSQNGEDFERIGTREAAGFSESQLVYDLLDEEPYKGISYYRLRQIDLDGTYEYSEIRTVYISEEKDNITVFPNPVRNEAMLYLQGLPEEDTHFELYNIKGQLIMNVSMGEVPNYEMSMKNFPLAAYFYVIRNAEKILKAGQLIIQE